ncbi:MAG: cobalamin-independent methionine synthase II family protein [Halodesulfurarchaeum sp.]
MSTSNEIHTTHVGSLPRSSAVREMLEQQTELDSPAFDEAVTDAVREVVRKQAEVGLDIANNGEQSRLSYSVDVTNRLAGFGDEVVERDRPADLDDFPEYADDLLGETDNIGGPIATGPIEYVGEDALRTEIERFEGAIEDEGVSFADRFYTAPSPGAVLRFTESTYHESTEAYLFDLADSLNTEYELIVESGMQLQIDAPDLLAGFTITYKESTAEEFAEHVGTYVEAINRALRGIDSDRIRLHACWGNYPGPHHHDVPLSAVIEEFYEADVSGLVVESANPRHQHEHETFREYPLPDGWTLIPGVIDVKTNIVEHPEVVADRLERFATVVDDPSNIVAAPDCGFETVVSGANAVHPSIAWKKLESLVEGAELASERLFD